MIAVDTNILVRHLTRDDPEQAERAHALLSRGDVFVSDTVILETVWVLQSAYLFTRAQISMMLDLMLDNKDIQVENLERMVAAVQAYRNGLDFADAVHLATCTTPTFATFDKALRRAAPASFATPEVIAP